MNEFPEFLRDLDKTIDDIYIACHQPDWGYCPVAKDKAYVSRLLNLRYCYTKTRYDIDDSGEFFRGCNFTPEGQLSFINYNIMAYLVNKIQVNKVLLYRAGMRVEWMPTPLVDRDVKEAFMIHRDISLINEILKRLVYELKYPSKEKNQPPPQALRFSHGRGESETSDW